MKRRSRAVGKAITASRRKVATRKRRRSLGKMMSGRRSGGTEAARLTHERDEAIEREKATADVLRVISSSPGDLKPVFAVILENATRLCQANFGVLFLCEADAYRAVAMHNAPSTYVEARERDPMVSMSGTTVLAKVARTKRTIQTADMAKDPAYRKNPKHTRLFVRLTGARSYVAVPMLKDNELVGAISIYRQEVLPFTDKQIELVQKFAAEAVIAIENTRLLNELRQRTEDLTESLEQQTATSEVLRIISSSPNELGPVFHTMLANATRLCGANFGTLNLHKDGTFPVAAMHDVPASYAEFRRLNPQFRVVDRHPLARVAAAGQVEQIVDMRLEPLYLGKDPSFIAMVERAGARTLFLVPMLKDNDVIGVITIFRQEVRPFTDKQIDLVKNFAAQAVIAVENTRLLNELRQSLEQQTATTEVLKVISAFPGELQPVFQATIDNATRLCGAKFGGLSFLEGDAFRSMAIHGVRPAYLEERLRDPIIRPTPGHNLERLLSTRATVHIPDLTSDVEAARALFERAGARALLNVPLLKGGDVLGSIMIYRDEPGGFTDKQIELVQNFAAQAVIAIENARLLNELRQSLEQQTATAEVLGIISSSPGELEPVFQAMLENATRICGASFGNLLLYEANIFRVSAMYGAVPEWTELRRREPLIAFGPKNPLARIITTKQAQHIADTRTDEAYLEGDRSFTVLADLTGARTLLMVPMLKDGELIGAIGIYRQEVRAFTDKQIELVQNFASQAVIAIENTRLLSELRESLQQQTATADVLKVISRSTFNLQTVLDTLVEFGGAAVQSGSFGHPAGEKRALPSCFQPRLLARAYRSHDAGTAQPGARFHRRSGRTRRQIRSHRRRTSRTRTQALQPGPFRATSAPCLGSRCCERARRSGSCSSNAASCSPSPTRKSALPKPSPTRR